MKRLILIVTLFFLLTVQAVAVPNAMTISVSNANIEFQLVDPSNNITGYDPVFKTKLQNIPNTVYEDVLPYEYYSKTPIGHNLHPLESSFNTSIVIGKYFLKIVNISNQQQQYSIDIKLYYYQNKNSIVSYYPDKMIYPNSTWIYEFNIPALPTGTPDITYAGVTKYGSSVLPLIKVANPQDLIIDINAAGSLGYIGNVKFVTELTKEINEIEAEKTKGKMDDGLTPAQKAKKEYTELLKEIAEKYNKPEGDEFVKKEAYDVLKEDIEYIIGHL